MTIVLGLFLFVAVALSTAVLVLGAALGLDRLERAAVPVESPGYRRTHVPME
jgi:hypothetical protein